MTKKTAIKLILRVTKFAGAILVIAVGLVFLQVAKVALAQTIITVDLKINGQDGVPGPVDVNQGGMMNVTWTVTPLGLPSINCPASGWWSGNKSYPTGSESVPVPSTSGSLRLACTISATEGGSDEVFFNVVGAATGVELRANGQAGSITVDSGTSVNLSWTTTNNPYLCQANWGVAGHLVDVNGGSEQVTVSSTTTFTVTCQRVGSPDSSASVTVQIGSVPPPPPPGGFSRLDFCTSYGDIVANIGFPSVPIPPAEANMVQIGDGGPSASFLTISPWPASLVKVVAGFVPGNTYFFKGYYVQGATYIITPWVSIIADASMPPCVGAPPPPPPPPPPPVTLDCSPPEWTDQFTKVSIEPLPENVVTVTYSGLAPGSTVDLTNPPVAPSPSLPNPFIVPEDLSKLPAPFAANTSNYLESPVGEQAHRDQNITALNSQDFNEYNRAAQKAAPVFMTDDLRVNYVKYVNNKPALKEAANTYSDYNGANPKTVAQMVTDYEAPVPPSHGGNQATWDTTWGLYWSKMPTAVDEYYLGFVNYLFAFGNPAWQAITNPDPSGASGYCPFPKKTFFFNMPNYFRAASVTNQINQLMVPKAAQSSRSDFAQNPGKVATSNENIQAENKEQKDNIIISTIKKLLKISLRFVNIVKDAYAQEDAASLDKCPIPIPILPNDKQGGGLYCHLLETLSGNTPNLIVADGDTCNDKIHCTIHVSLQTIILGVPNADGTGGSIGTIGHSWDSCTANKDSTGLITISYNCTITVRLYRTYYFPWLATAWNNSTYSDKADSIAILGSGLTGPDGQQTGRPGDYGLFTPKGVEPTVFSQGKNLPAADSASGNGGVIKQRFLGAVDCAKEFSRDKALKPLALQGSITYSPECGF